MPIERDLRGKRFFITGATGFLGTALVERIVRCVPDAEITVLVRPGRRADASARLAREVIKNDCFDRLRTELGEGFAAEIAKRVRAVPGDVSQDGLGLDEEGRDALAAADVVIHSAATVSFDAPLTQAVEINLLGPSRVAAAIAETGSAAHLVAVSTAYVASTHQGEAKEELLSENRFTLDVPWEAEVSSARRLRDDLEAESRKPEKLRGLHEAGASGDRRRRRSPDRVEGREDPRRVGKPRAGHRRHGTGDLARVARRLPLHEGARRTGACGAVGGSCPDHVSSGPPLLSPHCRSPEPAGSAASGWRSQSSSPTPGGSFGSSPACRKASST